jgi:hypothetical protein
MLVIDHASLDGNILHSGCSPDTEPQYLHTICLNYFPHSFNMLKWYKINFSWIQASPRGSCQQYHLVSSIYLLKPWEILENEWNFKSIDWPALCKQLGWGPVKVKVKVKVKVRVRCMQSSCKLLIVSKNVMCTQSSQSWMCNIVLD